MNRKQLIQNLLKSMDSMARVGSMPKHQELPKNMPPHGQMGVLFMVYHRGSLTIKDIAQRFGMTSSAATQLVNGLVKGGYLARKEDKADRRKMCVELTAKGKKIIGEMKQRRMKKMTELFAPLTDDELAQLQKIQTKIIEHWETVCKNKQNNKK